MSSPDKLKAALSDRYRIERELGAGGMATVYLAHDLKHDRKVAIKVLKPELAAVLGAERFVTEIKTTAALQHPNILPLFDSGTADGFLFYVMPYVEGETLRAKLDRETQFGVDEAVKITAEIADGLDYAHRHGVIHRDIKPENILLHDGRPMVADFGIALAVSAAAGGRMTETGLSLGTPHYMSPEQATAEKTITNRSDIYSLASVLYEMLSGNPPHVGASAQQIIMKIVTEEAAPVTQMRKSVPANVAAALATALEKLPADRFESARAFAEALNNPSFTVGTSAGGPVATAGERRAVRRWQFVAIGAVLVALAALASTFRRPEATPPRVVRFSLPAPSTTVGVIAQPAVSPDGRAVAFADDGGATPGIRVRWMDRATTDILPGTADARDLVFSPDGESIAYVTLGHELRAIGVDGRGATLLSQNASTYSGIAWGADGYIYYSPNDSGTALVRIPAAGGQPEAVATVPDASIKPTGAGELVYPLMLDDGRTLLATVVGPGASSDGQIVAFDVRNGSRTDLVAGIGALAVRDGWLLFAKVDGSIQAQRFDVSTRRVSGPAVPVLTGVYNQNAHVDAAVGRDGTLFYQPATSAVSRLTWVSRSGVESAVDSTLARPFVGVSLSPDGREIAATMAEGSALSAIWLYDLGRHTFTRLTPEGDYSFRPQWTPDGKSVLFSSDHGSATAKRSLFSVPIDGSDSLHLVLARARHVQEVSWPAAGGYFAFREGFDDGGTLRDIFAVAKGDTVARPVVVTKADELNPAVSPDGRWLAYSSNASGQEEVYLTPFPNGGARFQVSTAGGSSPVWARNGRELFYVDGKQMLVATDIDESRANPAGSSHTLFDAGRYFHDAQGQSFDVAPDGSRFLVIKAPPRASIDVVLGWWSETAAKLATAGK